MSNTAVTIRTLQCDWQDCTATFEGPPNANNTGARKAAKKAGWGYAPGSQMFPGPADFCPKHADEVAP